MDSAQIVVTVGGVLLILFTLWFFLGKRTVSQRRPNEGEYACPMHPWVTSDDPTEECSICGMKLVKRSG